MSHWSIETSAEFDKTFRKLDRTVAARLAAYLDELAGLDDPRSRGRGLTGGYAGIWRYRVGDYRLLAEVLDDRLVILAFEFVHHSTKAGSPCRPGRFVRRVGHCDVPRYRSIPVTGSWSSFP